MIYLLSLPDDQYDLYDLQWDVHVLTGALKLFFRELRQPVFPAHMYSRFTEAVRELLSPVFLLSLSLYHRYSFTLICDLYDTWL